MLVQLDIELRPWPTAGQSSPPFQDLQYATALAEVVYYDEEMAKVELARLTVQLGIERSLTCVSMHDAAGQRW